MTSHDLRIPAIRTAAPKDNQRAECLCSLDSSRGSTLEPRLAELEAHLRYIRRDMDAARSDLKSIQHRLAYSTGAMTVIIGLVSWIANSRIDQLVMLIN